MNDLEAIKSNWEAFKTAVGKLNCCDTAGFRDVNQTLGYNAAKAVPALVWGIEKAEAAEAEASRLLGEARATIQQLRELRNGAEVTSS